MKFIQVSRKSREHFSILSRSANATERVGRPNRAELIENQIFVDICEKVKLSTKRNILDIGSGCGNLARSLIEFSLNSGSSVTFVDSTEVIEVLKDENIEIARSQFKTVEGYFPDITRDLSTDYDCIIAYSVMHYVENPKKFILGALRLLDENGVLLIGDIPNSDKKRRFMREGNQNYRFNRIWKTDFSRHYSERELGRYIRLIRKRGFEAYLIPQNNTFPHSGSREDLLVFRNRIGK